MTQTDDISLNSPRAWLLAARPKTLPAAAVPVIIGTALAVRDGCFVWQPALLCCIFALTMQIAANLINDLLDYMRGTDGEERIGPRRACASGWVSVRAMRWAVALTIGVACAFGLLLLRYGGWWLVGVGAACVVFAFLYTTFMSYCGLGDVLVLVFFGIVPVTCTYYLQSGVLDAVSLAYGTACGLVIDTLLVVNNFRDADTDRAAGKRTIIVIFGRRFGSALYLSLGIAGTAVVAFTAWSGGDVPMAAVPLLYLIPHVINWRGMTRTWQGAALNAYLARTSACMMLFALLILAASFIPR